MNETNNSTFTFYPEVSSSREPKRENLKRFKWKTKGGKGARENFDILAVPVDFHTRIVSNGSPIPVCLPGKDDWEKEKRKD